MVRAHQLEWGWWCRKKERAGLPVYSAGMAMNWVPIPREELARSSLPEIICCKWRHILEWGKNLESNWVRENTSTQAEHLSIILRSTAARGQQRRWYLPKKSIREKGWGVYKTPDNIAIATQDRHHEKAGRQQKGLCKHAPGSSLPAEVQSPTSRSCGLE